MHTYRIILTPEPEGGFTIHVPALPGCITFGLDMDHALEMAREAIKGYLLILKEQGSVIPDDNETLEFSFSLSF